MEQEKFCTIVSDILVKNIVFRISRCITWGITTFVGVNVPYVGWYNILIHLVHSFWVLLSCTYCKKRNPTCFVIERSLTSKYGMGNPETILAANNNLFQFYSLEREHPSQTSDAYSRLGLMKDVYIRDNALRFNLNLNSLLDLISYMLCLIYCQYTYSSLSPQKILFPGARFSKRRKTGCKLKPD